MNIALRSRTFVLGFASCRRRRHACRSEPLRRPNDLQGLARRRTRTVQATAAELGQTITCNFTVVNTGDFPAQVTTLTEQSPFPSGDMVPISCTAGGTVISQGGTLAPDVAASRDVPGHRRDRSGALRNANVLDRVGIELLYTPETTGFPQPLTSGVFATHVTLIVCPATTPPPPPPTPTTPPPPPPTTASPFPHPRPRTRPVPTIRTALPATGTSSGVTIAAAVGMTVLGAADTAAQPPPSVVAPLQRRRSERSESAVGDLTWTQRGCRAAPSTVPCQSSVGMPTRRLLSGGWRARRWRGRGGTGRLRRWAARRW